MYATFRTKSHSLSGQTIEIILVTFSMSNAIKDIVVPVRIKGSNLLPTF